MSNPEDFSKPVAEKLAQDLNLNPAFPPEIDLGADAPSDAAPAVIGATQMDAASELLGTRADPDRVAPKPAPKVDPQEDQEPVAKTSMLTSSVVKVLAGVAILAVTAVTMWPSSPVVSPVAQTSIGTGTAIQSPTGAPAPTAPAGTPPGVTVDIGTGGGEVELMGDISSAAARLAPVDQTCNTLKITAFDRATCSIEGPEKFFRCTQETGRRWNADLPGCELIPAGSTVAGKFHQGVIPGMEDVLLLNRTSLLALADAPDSALVEALHRDVVADMIGVVGVSQGSAERLDVATRTSLAPFLISPEEVAASRVARTDERIPARLSCRMQAGRQTNADGSTAINLESPADIALDRCAGNALNPTGDPRAYIQMLRTSVAMIRADIQKAAKFGLVLDLQAGNAYQNRGAGSRSIMSDQEYVAKRLASGDGTSLPFYQFSLPRDGQRDLIAKNGADLDEDGTWRFCTTGDASGLNAIGASRDNLPLSEAFRLPGDAFGACLKFEGYAGPTIPKAVVIKDYEQFFKEKIDAQAVMLLSSPKLTGASDNKDGMSIGAVTMQPAGFRLVDARQGRVLTGVIPAMGSGAILTAGARP